MLTRVTVTVVSISTPNARYLKNIITKKMYKHNITGLRNRQFMYTAEYFEITTFHWIEFLFQLLKL